jgi:hypothetical protein
MGIGGLPRHRFEIADECGWTPDVLNIVQRVVESRRRGDESLSKKTNQRLLTSSPTNEFTNEDVLTVSATMI